MTCLSKSMMWKYLGAYSEDHLNLKNLSNSSHMPSDNFTFYGSSHWKSTVDHLAVSSDTFDSPENTWTIIHSAVLVYPEILPSSWGIFYIIASHPISSPRSRRNLATFRFYIFQRTFFLGELLFSSELKNLFHEVLLFDLESFLILSTESTLRILLILQFS